MTGEPEFAQSIETLQGFQRLEMAWLSPGKKVMVPDERGGRQKVERGNHGLEGQHSVHIQK